MSFAVIPKRETGTWRSIKCCWKYMLRKASGPPVSTCAERAGKSAVDAFGGGLGASNLDGGPDIKNIFVELRETDGWERRGSWELWVAKSCIPLPEITAGLYSGGFTTMNVALSDKCVFAVETTSAKPSMNLTEARRAASGSSSYTVGVVSGGFALGYVQTADKCHWFLDNASAEPLAALTTDRGFSGGAACHSWGLFAGGADDSGVVDLSDKCEWSTLVTSSQPSANLTSPKGDMASTRNNSRALFLGGYFAVETASVDKCVWATLTTSALTASLPAAKRSCAGYSAEDVGYVAGGWTGSDVSNTVDKVNNATDSISAWPTATLLVSRRSLAAVGYPLAAFFSGGCAVCPELVTDKINTATGVASSVSSAYLTEARHDLTGTYSI